MSLYSKTPKLAVNDPRGLAILAVDYWRADESLASEPRIERTLRDGAGRAIQQWDARLWALQENDDLTPSSLASVYSLNDSVLRSDSTDAGIQVQLPGLAGERLFDWDDRGTRREIDYDDLLRPVAVFEEGTGVPRRCAELFAYGNPGAGDPLRNQLGQLIRHDDPAGSVLFEQFALTGQCSENTRDFTLEPLAPDWPQTLGDRQKLLEPGAGATTQWRYAPLGAVLEQLDAGGHRQAFALTLDGRLRGVDLRLRLQTESHPVVSDIRYNAEGQITQERAGNGVLTTLSYRSEDGRLITRHAQDRLGNVLQHLLYAYDRMGNVLSIEDKALPVRWFANQRIEPISRYSYDTLYQLIKATGWEAGAVDGGPTAVVNYTQDYHYDAGGNLLKLSHLGAQSPGHQMQAARYSNRCLPWRNGAPPDEEEIAAAFDRRGNLLLLDQGRRLHWNLRNQLDSVVTVQRSSGAHDCEGYLYDGVGLRVCKTRSTQTRTRNLLAQVRYLPALELRSDTGEDERLQVITVQSGLNSVRVLHWLSQPPTGINNLYRYSFSDHLGSISIELDADAQVISREHFYPFGATAWVQAPDVSYKTVRYSGKERDATGMDYYGFRLYMPWRQRWLNPDPQGYVDGANLYQMVGNSPLTHVDIEGEKKTKAELLQVSVSKQASLLEVAGNRAFDLKHSLLNTAYTGHRMKAAGRRMGAAAGPILLNEALEAGGATVGSLAGPLGAMAGGWAGGKAADAVSAKIVEKYRLDRPIRLTGQEMNPKQIIEAVEPSKPRSLMTIKLDLQAMDPRVKEGRIQLGKNVVDAVVNKGVDKVGKKLGVLGPETLKVGFEVAVASMGLKAQVLSEIHDDTSTVIDLLEYRMDAIRTEFGESGSADEEVFGQVADLSVQTQTMVETLRRGQVMIALLAPSPYAGRRQSVSVQSGGKPLVRRASVG
jgi:RHS repeat-associated protein